MNEKHPDRTQEWQKQKEALQNPKTKSVPTAAVVKEVKNDKKETP